MDKWDLSLASVWNAIVWLMLMNFLVKIVTSTAQTYLKKQQERELAAVPSRELPAAGTSNNTDH